MFAINDIVIYSRTEVCRVEDIRMMPFLDQEKMEYYMLKPVYEDTAGSSTMYVPVTAGEDRIRRAFSADELKQILREPGERSGWVESPLIRKKIFNDIMGRNDPQELIGMVRAISRKQTEKAAAGQRLSESDEKYMVSAQKRLFRYTVNVEWDDFLKLLVGQEE